MRRGMIVGYFISVMNGWARVIERDLSDCGYWMEGIGKC